VTQRLPAGGERPAMATAAFLGCCAAPMGAVPKILGAAACFPADFGQLSELASG